MKSIVRLPLIFGLFMIEFFTACEVDPPINVGCESVPLSGINNVYPDKVYRNAPTSNPLNPNEFAYVAEDNNINGIWKYNLKSNLKSLIIEFPVWEVPDWSVSDWLVFGTNAQIYKCKSSGDSLTQLTFNNQNYDPSWSPDGERIIYWRRDSNSNFQTILMDKNGITLDSLSNISGYPYSYSPDGEKIAFVDVINGTYVISYVLTSDPSNVITIENSNVGNTHEFIDWFPDSITIVYTLTNLESIDIYTGIKKTIYLTGECYSYFQFHTILSDGETIITNWIHGTFYSESNSFYHDYDLLKVNTDGSSQIIPYFQ